jgi:hypothetical protein
VHHILNDRLVLNDEDEHCRVRKRTLLWPGRTEDVGREARF